MENKMTKEQEQKIEEIGTKLEAKGIDEFNLGSNIFYISSITEEIEEILSATWKKYCSDVATEEEIASTFISILKDMLEEC